MKTLILISLAAFLTACGTAVAVDPCLSKSTACPNKDDTFSQEHQKIRQ